MNHLHNAWRPMLLGALLMLVLVGVAGAVPTDQPHALSARRQIMISAADFYPCDDSYDYSNYGDSIYLGGDTSFGYFMAPVDFSYPLWITIDKFELFAYDNNATGNITGALHLSKPDTHSQQVIASVDTGAGYASPTYGTWSDTTITPNVKNPANDVYVYLYISNPSNLSAIGARVFYYEGK